MLRGTDLRGRRTGRCALTAVLVDVVVGVLAVGVGVDITVVGIGEEAENLLRDGADHAAGKHGAKGASHKGIIQGSGEVFGAVVAEVTVFHRYGGDDLLARGLLGKAIALIVGEEEGAVVAVIEMRDDDGAAHRHAEGVADLVGLGDGAEWDRIEGGVLVIPEGRAVVADWFRLL